MKRSQNLEDEKYLAKNIHFYLVNLSYYNSNSWGVEEDLIEDCMFRELLNKEWGDYIFSEKTIELLTQFRIVWLKYKENSHFAGDVVFMFIDEMWHQIVQQRLIPSIVSIERDFVKHQIVFNSYKINYIPNSRPLDEDLLERGGILYKLLLEKRIVKKRYMK